MQNTHFAKVRVCAALYGVLEAERGLKVTMLLLSIIEATTTFHLSSLSEPLITQTAIFHVGGDMTNRETFGVPFPLQHENASCTGGSPF